MSEIKNGNGRNIIDKKTLLPIGFVISIIAAVWFFATLNANVQANTEDILDRTTQTEFNAIKDDVIEIKADVKKLLNK